MHEQRTGASAVEMAIVLPVFLMVVFGIIEFGRAMMVAQLVTNAAREGARLAIIDGSTNPVVETSIKEFLRKSCNAAPADVQVDINVTPDPSNPDPANQLNASTTGDIVTVSVSVPFNKVSLIRGTWLNASNIVSQATMRHE